MPLSPTALAAPVQSIDLSLDARWAMAYAAGVPDERPELYATDDTRRPGGVVVHPLLPVAAEWQLITSMRATGTGLDPSETRRGIHVGHDLVLAAPIVAGTEVHLSARTVAVGRRRAGATQTVEFTATAEGSVLWRTRMTSLYLGVELAGDPAADGSPWPDALAAAPAGAAVASQTSPVRAVDAHVYTECARIWNPIHTDVVAAHLAGLRSPILHGTATLARSVSIASRLTEVPLEAIGRVTASFSGQVELGSSFDVRVLGVDRSTVWFDAVLPDGTAALRDAAFTFAT